tara:strand:- start:660 stop:977 length:318 start_codon:yes stop_codon:yes gene_type:complete
MKVGISVRIDVTKIDKARLYKGAKGTYLDLTTFVDTDQKDQYENNGFISQSVDKEEREQGVKTPILGNVKVFFLGETERVQQQTNNEWTGELEANSTEIDEDIPF